MNQGSKRTINGFITMLLMVVSIGMLFLPWITLDDKDARVDMKDAMEDIGDELEDLDDGALDLLDFALDQADVPYRPNSLCRLWKKWSAYWKMQLFHRRRWWLWARRGMPAV